MTPDIRGGFPGPSLGLPVFRATDDPGPDFAALLHTGATGRTGAFLVPADLLGGFRCDPAAGGLAGAAGGSAELRHGTTIVALRFGDGIVMAGDRRATEGNIIANRTMDKVYPADRYSAVAIAGIAGPAIEMVRLFQTQLEHYEKVEGVALSLEGKANQLGVMVREHFPLAMQGLVVLPLFAGYDLRRSRGRIFTYDVTGGHYEEAEFHATGSGGRDARTTIKLGFRDDLPRDAAVELAVQALFEAADEDAATGGPDVVRGIYPTVATVTASGYDSVVDAEVAERFHTLIERKRARGHAL